ncbi:MAG: serine/threonine-protein kinase [Acidobacteria bacterium]|nr:MAG: serine/threonine-protein kinase [Acidobacteriota bacterium]
MRTDERDSLLGRVIADRYRIEAKIGQGGMGSVYRARNVVTGKQVAIKVLLQDLAAYESFVQRFLHEARAAAYLNHPHAINIIDCGRDGEVVYLLMEYVEGRTLTEVMREEGPFPLERAAVILKQICAAVADAHAQSIIHRDLKPDNIMLQSVAGHPDYVKVLDFGIAKVLDEQKRGSGPVSKNIFVGTPEYASPEQCNSKRLTPLSDIYSLGTILYQMLTGTPPFTGEPMEVMLKHIHEDPPPLSSFRPDIDQAVEEVLRRALSKNPHDRQQHVLDLAEEFEAAIRRGSAHRPMVGERTGRVRIPASSPPVHPTEVATTISPELSPVSPGIRVWWRWRMGIVLVMAAVGLGAGFKFYRWYHIVPELPRPPEMKLARPPALPTKALTEARRLFEEGNRDGAVRALIELLDNDQGFNPQAHNLLGQIYFDQGDYDGARREFALAIDQMEGVYPDARYHLALLLREQGQRAEAERQFQRALEESNGFHLPTLVALGALALERGQVDEAESLFHRVIAQAGDAPEELLQVGRVLMLRKQYELAIREFRQAIALRQGFYPEAALYLGLTLIEQGDLASATAILQQAVEQCGGNYAEARKALGLVLYRRGAYTEAIEELKAAIRLRGGNFPAAEFALGTVLADWAIGRYEQAERYLQLAITHRAGHFPEARRALGRLYWARLGQLDKARRIWTELGDDLRIAVMAQAIQLDGTVDRGVEQRVGGRPLDAGDRLAFAFVPVPGEAGPPTVTFTIGDHVLHVHYVNGAEESPPHWVASIETPGGQHRLSMPIIENQLMGKVSVQVVVRVGDEGIVLTLDGQDVDRVDSPLPASVWARVRGGRLILYEIRWLDEREEIPSQIIPAVSPRGPVGRGSCAERIAHAVS